MIFRIRPSNAPLAAPDSILKILFILSIGLVSIPDALIRGESQLLISRIDFDEKVRMADFRIFRQRT
jgi:hypothetical protein